MNRDRHERVHGKGSEGFVQLINAASIPDTPICPSPGDTPQSPQDSRRSQFFRAFLFSIEQGLQFNTRWNTIDVHVYEELHELLASYGIDLRREKVTLVSLLAD